MPLTSYLVGLSKVLGVKCEVVCAPSILDHYTETFPLDLARPGTLLVDARELLANEYTLEPRLNLIICNAGYLSPVDRLAFYERIMKGRGECFLTLYKARDCGGSQTISCSLTPPSIWGNHLDHNCTIIVHGTFS